MCSGTSSQSFWLRDIATLTKQRNSEGVSIGFTALPAQVACDAKGAVTPPKFQISHMFLCVQFVFVYVAVDFKVCASYGFAFVNFFNSDPAETFRKYSFQHAGGLRTKCGVVRGPNFVARHLEVSYASLLDLVVPENAAELHFFHFPRSAEVHRQVANPWSISSWT